MMGSVAVTSVSRLAARPSSISGTVLSRLSFDAYLALIRYRKHTCGPTIQSCKVSSLCNGDNADGGHGDSENDVDHSVDGQRVPHSRKAWTVFSKFVQTSLYPKC